MRATSGRSTISLFGDPVAPQDEPRIEGEQERVEAIMADSSWHSVPELQKVLKQRFGQLYGERSAFAAGRGAHHAGRRLQDAADGGLRMSGTEVTAANITAHSADTPQLLLEHHLKELRLPTILREYDKIARQCAIEQVDYQHYLLRITELELLDRERRVTDRRIRQAKFPVLKTMDSFDFLAIPSLNKTMVPIESIPQCSPIRHRSQSAVCAFRTTCS